MKKLSIGISNFVKLREEDYLYIDKTAEIQDLTERYSCVFLSRPRRFGKSLLTDTLQCLFEGRQDLFKGLAIEDQYDWSKKYPVIKLSLSGRYNSLSNSEETLFKKLESNAERLGVTGCAQDLCSNYLHDLIIGAYEKYQEKVVILIDECDEPILRKITNIEVASQVRRLFQGFYGTMRGLDELIHFVFITGIAKFSKTSIFSGLNNLKDISFAPRYSTLCGYTQHDLETIVAKHLEGFDWDQFKRCYNGYNFSNSLDSSKKELVYNPFDIYLAVYR